LTCCEAWFARFQGIDLLYLKRSPARWLFARINDRQDRDAATFGTRSPVADQTTEGDLFKI